MKFRSFEAGFVPIFDVWFAAKTPEELKKAVRKKVVDWAKGTPTD